MYQLTNTGRISTNSWLVISFGIAPVYVKISALYLHYVLYLKPLCFITGISMPVCIPIQFAICFFWCLNDWSFQSWRATIPSIFIGHFVNFKYNHIEIPHTRSWLYFWSMLMYVDIDMYIFIFFLTYMKFNGYTKFCNKQIDQISWCKSLVCSSNGWYRFVH